MATETFVLTDDVNVEIKITELGDGTLQFDIKVLNDTGSIGDLNAFFFDLADDSLTNGLIIDGPDVTDVALKVDGVTKVDNYTNMNGGVVKELGKFDGGIQFGTQGIGVDDILETSFVLSHDGASLSLQDFNLQDFGLRLTSVGPEDGSRDGSLKLGGTLPEFPEAPEEPEEPEGPVIVANDDSMTVTENETFNPPFVGSDYLDDFVQSVLANDDSDSMPYLGAVTEVNGNPADVGEIVLGSDGGAIRIYADGSVDFSARTVDFGQSDFAYLEEGEFATTTFEYGIEGDATATLTVTVTGISDDIFEPPLEG